MMLFLTATAGKTDDALFQDDFQGKLGEGHGCASIAKTGG